MVDLEVLVQPLQFFLLYVELSSTPLKCKYYTTIISYLIKIITQISISDNDIQKIKSIIFIIYVFIYRLQK